MKKNNFVVYTALFGNYDDLLDPAPSDHCDYVCFTDDPLLTSNIWDIRIVPSHLPANMMSRLYKIKPHDYLPDYKASIYVDSNIKILQDPISLFNKYLEISKLSAIKHVERSCLYDEALFCIAERKTNYSMTLNQMLFYAKDGYPPRNSLSENRVLIRSHNEKDVVNIMEMWWEQLNRWTQRDQLSLCYVVWKLKYKIGFISENPRFENDYFKWLPHKGNENRLLYRVIRKVKFYITWVLIYPYYVYKIGIIRKKNFCGFYK